MTAEPEMWSWLPGQRAAVPVLVMPAEPGTEDAERLALAVVLGTRALIDQGVPDK